LIFFEKGPVAWDAQVGASVKHDDSPCRRWACQIDKISFPKIWEITCNLARGFPIVMTMGLANKCQPMVQYLEENGIAHVAPYKRGREDEWYDFHTGQVDVCVTTLNNILGRNFARRIVTVFAGVPTWITAVLLPTSNVLIFFEKDDDLKPFKKAGLQIRMLSRDQYDPMEVGSDS
jgi:hypothetical protein